jgi:hypothetical protein
MLIFLARRSRATLFQFFGVVKAAAAVILLFSCSTVSIAFTLPCSAFSKRFFSLSFFRLYVRSHPSKDIPVGSRFWRYVADCRRLIPLFSRASSVSAFQTPSFGVFQSKNQLTSKNPS